MIELTIRRISSTDYKERRGIRDRVQVNCVVEATRNDGTTYPFVTHIVESDSVGIAFFFMNRDLDQNPSLVAPRKTDFYRTLRGYR